MTWLKNKIKNLINISKRRWMSNFINKTIKNQVRLRNVFNFNNNSFLVCRLNTEASFSVVTDRWVLIRTKPVSVYQSLWSNDWMVWSTLSLWAFLTANKNPGFCFADFRWCLCWFFNIQTVPKRKLN